MKKIFLFLTFCLVILSACDKTASPQKKDPLPEIGWTEVKIEDISTIQDEWMQVPLEALPFSVEIPSEWTFIETPPEYLLWFDKGLTGSLVFQKKGKPSDSFEELMPEGASSVTVSEVSPEITIFCREELQRRFCVLKLENRDEIYTFIINNKALTPERLAQIEDILKRFDQDLLH